MTSDAKVTYGAPSKGPRPTAAESLALLTLRGKILRHVPVVEIVIGGSDDRKI